MNNLRIHNALFRNIFKSNIQRQSILKMHQSSVGEIAKIDSKTDMIEVKFQDGVAPARYPWLWLRDNCQCSECFHPVSLARLFLLKDLESASKPTNVQQLGNNRLKVTWSDSHVSEFCTEWLKDRYRNEENLIKETAAFELPERMWYASEMQDNIPSFEFNEIMGDEQVFLKWLSALETDGLCLVTRTPAHTGILSRLCGHVAFTRNTAYGDTFRVESKEDPNNVAYTTASLGLHTDLPQYQYVPGVQLLHCIKKAESGGRNMFADSFRAAMDMRREEPELYQTLCHTPVNFSDKGQEKERLFNLRTRHRTFEFDSNGKLTRVNYNNQIRDSMMNLPPEEVQQFYKALVSFEKRLNDPRYCVKHSLQPGEIVCFHNYRVMHGREEYVTTDSQERLLEGAYLDWDEIRSKRRVLQEIQKV